MARAALCEDSSRRVAVTTISCRPPALSSPPELDCAMAEVTDKNDDTSSRQDTALNFRTMNSPLESWRSSNSRRNTDKPRPSNSNTVNGVCLTGVFDRDPLYFRKLMNTRRTPKSIPPNRLHGAQRN